MPDRVMPADPGLLSSVADEIALPGYMVRNVFRGDVGAASRNLADLVLNIPDAILPGDLIPEISRREDRPEFTDLTGPIDGFAGDLVNLAGNIATDPLTFVPGAAVAKAAGAAAKGVKAITPKVVQEGVAKVAKPVGKFIRKTAGAERIGKPLANVITAAQGAKDVVGRAGSDALVEGLKGASLRELEAAGEVMTNITKDKATGALRAIDDSDTLSVQDRLARYLMDNPDVDPTKLMRIVETSGALAKSQWESGKAAGTVGGNIFTDLAGQPDSDVVLGALGGTTGQAGVRDYFPRIFKNESEADALDRLAQPSAIKGRKLETSQDVLAHLAAHPEISLTTNAAEALSQRAAQQAELASRGAFGRGLFDLAKQSDVALPDELLEKVLSRSEPKPDVASMLAMGGRPVATGEKALGAAPDVVMGGPAAAAGKSGLSESQRKQAREWLLSQDYKQADPLMRETAEAIARALPEDEADVAMHFLKGMNQRGAFAKGLAALNRPFKPVAVYGALVPKLGSLTRNMTGGTWMKYSNPEARDTISVKNIPSFLRDWWASMEDGLEHLFGKRLFTKNEFAQVDEAYRLSGGDPRKALSAIKDPVMRSAVERGVLGNNFVDTEGLISQTQRSGPLKYAQKAWDYPAAMFRGTENRMRYGLFKSLVKAGKSEDDAARIVREALYDYAPSSAENRLARDVIPFFQFIAKSAPQQAKLMAEKPYIASGVANAYAQGRDEPVSPMMEGRLNLPIGTDELGNQQYLTGLGLPFESLSMIPNFSANPLQAGRQVEQNIIGATTPLLKTAIAYTTGRDPVFGSTPGSYQKIAGQDLGKFGGFVNQLAGTGLAPLTAAQQLAGLAGRVSDDRTTAGEKLLTNLTGARIQSVDPEKAIQDRLQAFLERDPSVRSFRKFYQSEGDTTAESLLEELHAAQKAIKEKKKAQAAVH